MKQRKIALTKTNPARERIATLKKNSASLNSDAFNAKD